MCFGGITMSKVSNVLNMLLLLKSRGRMKIKEIAEILEVEERSVRKYREDLEMAGIHIKSLQGINGGYELESPEYILDLILEEEEYYALQLASQHLKEDGFVYEKELEKLLDKLRIIKKEKEPNFEEMDYVYKATKGKNIDVERKVSLDINRAIISRNKVRINYNSLSSGISKRVVQPYAIINYKGAVYFVGYCENRRELREFKVSRIKEYEVLDEKFQRDKDFSIKQYMKDSLGIYKGDKINIKLKISKPMSYIVNEKRWVENQDISWNEDESIIFEATMMGWTEIKSWILSMGKNAEVLEPKELAKEIQEELKAMTQIYLNE